MYLAILNTALLFKSWKHNWAITIVFYVLYLSNDFFSSHIVVERQEYFAFISKSHPWTFTMFLQGYLHSFTIWHGIAISDLAEWTKPSTVQILHYTEETLIQTGSKDLDCLWNIWVSSITIKRKDCHRCHRQGTEAQAFLLLVWVRQIRNL